MSKRIKVRMRDSVMAGTLAGTFADKTIERLTPGDPTIIGRDVERLMSRLLNAHHARRHRVAAEELALSDQLGAAWSTVAKTLDALDRVVREAEEMDRKIAAPTVPFAAANKTSDGGKATSMADIIGNISKANREFWKPRES